MTRSAEEESTERQVEANRDSVWVGVGEEVGLTRRSGLFCLEKRFSWLSKKSIWSNGEPALQLVSVHMALCVHDDYLPDFSWRLRV